MEHRRVTLIVSDLHMGDGKTGDDFVDDHQQFTTFLKDQMGTPEGEAGQIELIVNGDFLEFVQVYPRAYQGNFEYWCTEEESTRKLSAMLKGHADVFDALRKFQKSGNRVTLFAGNHDVDLYWDDCPDGDPKESGRGEHRARQGLVRALRWQVADQPWAPV